MESIWMRIAPNATSTRVLAMAGAHDTFLKARLLRSPAHPRALALLLEAIAPWQGKPIRAALSADDTHGGFASTFFQETFSDAGTPLYTLDWIPGPARVRRAVAATSPAWVTSRTSGDFSSRRSRDDLQ